MAKRLATLGADLREDCLGRGGYALSGPHTGDLAGWAVTQRRTVPPQVSKNGFGQPVDMRVVICETANLRLHAVLRKG